MTASSTRPGPQRAAMHEAFSDVILGFLGTSRLYALRQGGRTHDGLPRPPSPWNATPGASSR